MLILSEREEREWREYADGILRDSPAPDSYDSVIRPGLVPAFHFYIATYLASKGAGEQAFAWAKAGVLKEDDGLFGLAFFLGFLERYGNRLVKPSIVFEDPRPFHHFTTVPLMNGARKEFIRLCGRSLPVFEHPVRFMDIGCGSGELAVAVLKELRDNNKIPGVSEVLLIEPSPAMAALAEKNIRSAFPDAAVMREDCRIQDCSGRIDRKFDIAMSSLACHHMPVEEKRIHLARLRPWIDHFLLFEIDADIDSPDLYSPSLALTVYQSFGRIFDRIYAEDAPVEVVNDCIDMFLMTEAVSIFTEPRGERSEYHMLRSQWNDLLAEVLGPDLSLRSDHTCYADEHLTIFTLHYGRAC
jgi:SAM-dependent methyltransferase